MKQLKLVTLAACMLTAGVVSAGTLQVTPVVYAAESIVVGNALNAPVFSYSLAAPISIVSSPVFTAEFKLNNALWNAALGVADVVMVSPDGTKGLQATSVVLNTATDTMIATFTVSASGTGASGTALAPTGSYTFPIGTNIIVGQAGAAPVIKATSAQTAPALTCTATTADTTLTVTVKNALGTETETVAPLAVLGTSTYLQSKTALSIVGQASTGTAAETSKIDVTSPALGTLFTNDADAGSTATNTNVVQIGRVVITNNSLLKDATSAAGAFNYTVNDATLGVAGPATAIAGNVSLTNMNLVVNGTFNTAGTVYLSSVATCLDEVNLTTGAAAGLASGTAASAAARAVLTGTSATFTSVPVVNATFANVAGVRTAYVCYKRDIATSTAMTASQFTLGTSAIAHAATESGPSPICGTNLYNLQQNGVQIDVRNFVGGATPAAMTGGWMSVLRVINTDQSQTANVTAQIIKNDGTVLAGKTIATLAPNAYTNLTSAQIEASLAGSASAGYLDAASVNTRLRVSAPVSSLRVQNYLYNPASKSFLEADGSQGDEQPGAGGALVNADQRK